MDQASHYKIVSFIWSIADGMHRDPFVPGKCHDVILLEPTKKAMLDTKAKLDKAGNTERLAALCWASGQAFYNTSQFILRDLKARANQEQLKAEFDAYLGGFSSNVQDILALEKEAEGLLGEIVGGTPR